MVTAALDKILYPFAGHYQRIGGHNLHYLDEGRGDPVLMLHGNPTWSFYYRNLIQTLSPHTRCLAPDHIGCGLSDKPAESDYSYTLAQRVEDLVQFVAALDLSNLTLILHDWGGMIGMALAVSRPELIKRLVIFNTGAFHLPAGKPFPWPLWLAGKTRLGDFLVRRFNAFSLGASYFCCTRKKMSREVRRAYCHPYREPQNRLATLRFVQDIPLQPADSGYDLVSQVQGQLERFAHLPILICWGEKDFVFDRYFLEQWLVYYPGAEVHRFADCGHYILEDAEEIPGLVLDFLQRHRLEEEPL